MNNETYCGSRCLYRRWREQFFQFALEKEKVYQQCQQLLDYQQWQQLLAPNAVKLSVQAPAVVVTYPDIVSKSRRSWNNQGNQYFLYLPIYFEYLAHFWRDLGDGEDTSPCWTWGVCAWVPANNYYASSNSFITRRKTGVMRGVAMIRDSYPSVLQALLSGILLSMAEWLETILGGSSPPP